MDTSASAAGATSGATNTSAAGATSAATNTSTAGATSGAMDTSAAGATSAATDPSAGATSGTMDTSAAGATSGAMDTSAADATSAATDPSATSAATDTAAAGATSAATDTYAANDTNSAELSDLSHLSSCTTSTDPCYSGFHLMTSVSAALPVSSTNVHRFSLSPSSSQDTHNYSLMPTSPPYMHLPLQTQTSDPYPLQAPVVTSIHCRTPLPSCPQNVTSVPHSETLLFSPYSQSSHLPQFVPSAPICQYRPLSPVQISPSYAHSSSGNLVYTYADTQAFTAVHRSSTPSVSSDMSYRQVRTYIKVIGSLHVCHVHACVHLS